jgi:monovalent cation:H+ antiporter, CPA1 family
MNKTLLHSSAGSSLRLNAGIRQAARIHSLTTTDVMLLLLALSVVVLVVNYIFFQWADLVAIAAGSVLLTTTCLVISMETRAAHGWSITDFRSLFLDFPDLVVNDLVGCFIFAGAIQVHVREWQRIRLVHYVLCFCTNVISSIFVGILTYFILFRISRTELQWCLLFGAALSPTKPSSVIKLLDQDTAIISRETLEFAKAEALLTDFTGILVYLFFTAIVRDPYLKTDRAVLLFLKVLMRQYIAGVVLGAVLAMLASLVIRNVDHVGIEVGTTFVLVGVLNVTCRLTGASIPLAAVAAGVIVRKFCYQDNDGFSEAARPLFQQTWALLDIALKSVLFLMLCVTDTFYDLGHVGLLNVAFLVTSIICACIFARFASLAFPLYVDVCNALAMEHPLRIADARGSPYTFAILTWGGMRGSISLPLTLGIPDSFAKHAIPGRAANGQLLIFMAYTVVIFSMCVQSQIFDQIVKLSDNVDARFDELASGFPADQCHACKCCDFEFERSQIYSSASFSSGYLVSDEN